MGVNPSAPAARRSPHRSPALIGLVAAGGAVGSLSRWGLAQWVNPLGGWPLQTLIVNTVGSFLLGLLLESLALRGTESARGRLLRLGAGTGFLGGLTTFSTFAVETERLMANDTWGVGLGYPAVTLVLGVAAVLGGVMTAQATQRRQRAGADA